MSLNVTMCVHSHCCILSTKQVLPRWLSGKESTCRHRSHRRQVSNPWVRKISWRRKWQPTAVFLPIKSHGQRSLAGYSPLVTKSRTQVSAHARAHTHTHTHTHTHSLSNHITIYLFVPLTDIGVVSKILLLQTILQKISLYLNRSIDLSIYTYLLRANYNFQTSFF